MKKRAFEDLHEEEIDRLYILNQKLIEAEEWILARGKQCLADYLGSGGKLNHLNDDSSFEDAELEAVVRFILKDDHPDFMEDDDNFVTMLRWNLLPEIGPVSKRRIRGRRYDWTFSKILFRKSRLDEFRHCRLFRDLYDHALAWDWDRMLSIGGLWIDVILTQKRDRPIGPPLDRKFGDPRSIDTLGEPEITRLRLMNQKLIEAESWMVEHATQCRESYFRSGGLERWSDQDIWEDFEIETDVIFALGSEHPDFNEASNNVVSSLRHHRFNEDRRTFNWNDIENGPLADDHHCYLFHHLYDHSDLEWDDVLSVDEFWIDVKLIQQRGISWRCS
jgi:hypothetical protein